MNAEYVQFIARRWPRAWRWKSYLRFRKLFGKRCKCAWLRMGAPHGRVLAQEWKDLAPRDVVARAIHHEMETHDYPYVLLGHT